MPDPFAPVLAALARPGRPSSDLDLSPDANMDQGRNLRPAAVLIALTPSPTGLQLYLTKRSAHLRHHPGQIALPGGKIEHGDLTPALTALREAREEIGLPPENVEILGTLPAHETVTRYLITPVIGRVNTPFHPRPEPGEVEECFTIPFAQVATPDRFRVESRPWQGTMRRYYVAPYGPYYIWGATARILHSLAERMVSCPK